ncbi:hypothetical protein WR25_04148 [Diploscapter pachys]|uniref:Uncharacterized protein n=1 Tax=Diploscapter pachys TaxID=2018661 RepID=A0A2A2JUT9_9BILA|nr:hypothetical protein WR25_04148 [Diploscapter pachys]
MSALCILRPCCSKATRVTNRILVQNVRHISLPDLSKWMGSFKIYSLRRRFAEMTSNKYQEKRVTEVGPDLACLEWLMECGATAVQMSDDVTITSQKQMKEYLDKAIERKEETRMTLPIVQGDLAYEKKHPNAPRLYITNVDASDSAISNEGFKYFSECRRINRLKLNFCDYFTDDAIRELAMGRPADTVTDIEIAFNPSVSDAAVYWLVRLKSLRRAHFYFLPYVAHRLTFARHLKMALPKCTVTFPESEYVGFGYDEPTIKKR